MPGPENSSESLSEFDPDIARNSNWVIQSHAQSGFDRTLFRVIRWLIIAAYFGLSFFGLCMIVAITIAAVMFKENVFVRGELYAGLAFLIFGFGLAVYVKKRLLPLDEPRGTPSSLDAEPVDR